MLTEKSPYFKACLKHHWKEDKAKNIKLEDVCVSSFRIVIRWLYNEDWKDSFENLSEDIDWELKCKVYKVADRLMIERLQNQLMDTQLWSMWERPVSYTPERLQRLNNLGLAHTKLYEMMLKHMVKKLMTGKIDTEELSKALDTLDDSKKILQEVLLSMNTYALKPWEEVWKMDKCAFHVHMPGENCAEDSKTAKAP